MTVSAAFGFGSDLFGPVCAPPRSSSSTATPPSATRHTFADGHAASDWAVKLGVPPEQAAKALAKAQ